MQTCVECCQAQNAQEFSYVRAGSEERLAICNACSGVGGAVSKRNRRRHLRHNYGLSLVEYTKMSEGQNNRCRICEMAPDKSGLFVDHDHLTGKVRGLLCHKCNIGLGWFADNRGLLQKAIEYLDPKRCSIDWAPQGNT